MNNLVLKNNLNFISKKYLRRATSKQYEFNYGFTLIEMMITVFMIGILSAIVAPSWIGFVNVRRLNTAQDQVYRAIREAQSNAKRDKIAWQVSFQENNGIVQWAVHPTDSTPIWNNLEQNIQIYKEQNNQGQCETNLYLGDESCPATSPWGTQFNYKGQPLKSDQQITLSSKNGDKTQRCVNIYTILGAIRTGKDHPTANSDGKYCY